jgi:hypothetical protein
VILVLLDLMVLMELMVSLEYKEIKVKLVLLDLTVQMVPTD